MTDGLLGWTKVVLIVSIVTQTAFGVLALFARPLWDSLLLPPPLEPVSAPLLHYFGALYVANAIGAVYALYRDAWPIARTYLVIALPYVAMFMAITLLVIATTPGAPPILWLYVVLNVAYLPLAGWAWLRETSGRGG